VTSRHHSAHGIKPQAHHNDQAQSSYWDEAANRDRLLLPEKRLAQLWAMRAPIKTINRKSKFPNAILPQLDDKDANSRRRARAFNTTRDVPLVLRSTSFST